MMGNSGVGRRVGHGQEIAGLGTEDEVGNLVVEDIEVEVCPRERNSIGKHPFEPVTRNVLYLGAATQVVVDDPQLRYAVLGGPSDQGRPRFVDAGCPCHQVGWIVGNRCAGVKKAQPRYGLGRCLGPEILRRLEP